jgi:ATP-dependent Clp protease ATP-binding subunit ClpA
MRKLIQRVEEKTSTSVDLPLSPASKRVLAYGAEEAEILAHKNIGTSHLLLGLLREESRAAEFLREHGVEIEALRKHVKRETAAAETESPPAMERIKGVLQRAMGGRFTASRVEDGWRIVESQHHVGGHEIRLTERMLLSEDGKTLHYTVEIHGPDGQEHHHRVEFLVE